MTRYVIHNHIPAKRTKDSSGAFLGAGQPKEGDPNYKKWAEQQRQQQNRGGGFHNDACDDETPYWSIVMKGWMLRQGGQSYGPFKSEAEANAKKTELSNKDARWGKRDSVGVVSREAEERNRDRMYRDTGITRN